MFSWSTLELQLRGYQFNFTKTTCEQRCQTCISKISLIENKLNCFSYGRQMEERTPRDNHKISPKRIHVKWDKRKPLIVLEQHIQKCSNQEAKIIEAYRLYLKSIPFVRLYYMWKNICRWQKAQAKRKTKREPVLLLKLHQDYLLLQSFYG